MDRTNDSWMKTNKLNYDKGVDYSFCIFDNPLSLTVFQRTATGRGLKDVNSNKHQTLSLLTAFSFHETVFLSFCCGFSLCFVCLGIGILDQTGFKKIIIPHFILSLAKKITKTKTQAYSIYTDCVSWLSFVDLPIGFVSRFYLFLSNTFSTIILLLKNIIWSS